jgi:putative aldouronate transport system substrate-binding protein
MKRTLLKIAVMAALFALAVMPIMAGGSQASSGSAAGGPVEIEVFVSPWVNSPMEDPDPYRDWLNEQTGAKWSMSYALEDFMSELTTRAVAGDMPDLIVNPDRNVLYTLHQQGITIDDWNVYKSQLPQTFANMTEVGTQILSTNGKLYAVPTKNGPQQSAFFIRQDWLDKLGLKMPATPDELFEVCRAFTFNDPDGNGKNDTYGFSVAGGMGIGEFSNLGLMYGPTNWYVGADGKVAHPVTDGNLKKQLDYIKRIVDAGIVNPDWYELGWDDRKPNLFNGLYGLAHYPPRNLHMEIEDARHDGAVLNWWSYMPMPKGSAAGGKLNPGNPYGWSVKTVSADAGKDSAKMAAICKVLELIAFPNRGRVILQHGVDIDHVELIDVPGTSYNYIDTYAAYQRGYLRGHESGQRPYVFNWGILANTEANNTLEGQTPQPGPLAMKYAAQEGQITNADFYDMNYQLLNLNREVSASAQTVYDEFIIQYILGQTTDYNGFVQRWLAAGGQALIDEATQQFKSYGVIK